MTGSGDIMHQAGHDSVTGKPPPDGRERIESIYRAAPIGIGLVKDRTILEVNDRLCRMIGYTREELVGLNTRIFYPSDDEYDYVGKEKYRQLREQGTSSVKTRFRAKTGDTLDILLSSAPIDPEDLSAGVTFTALDITRDIQREEQLRQARKMEAIGVLAGGIAHDFNNILFPIMGHAELLLEDIPADSPFRNNLNKIHAASLRARDLVRQILTFSRQEKKRPRVLSMQPVIKEVMKMIRATMPASIRIIEKIDADCGPVRADPTQIHQVVMNLATNSFHAMEETGGELTVFLTRVDDLPPDLKTPKLPFGPWICLSVSDTGTGMDSLTAGKIFDPFFTTKKPRHGTGMGLSVVHGIVTDMKGAIKVVSEPGRGTTVDLYFSSVTDAQAHDSAQVDEQIPGGNEKILLVDDEPEIISMEKQMLEWLGYDVTAFTSSAEALGRFKTAPELFDLVITDMAMPGMSGDKLAGKLLKIRPDIPMLICTGFSRIMDSEKAASLGFKGFLYKPVLMKDLAGAIRRALDSQT
ncbi:MAG: response regulator [Desulfotignum balticum]|uniref:histidine kinase n=1 Tax=Desulfotignum balticum TaxID=115781 RepID=A0A931CQS6_9BACT|nr:response regulator [Desulfotignum balticum]